MEIEVSRFRETKSYWRAGRFLYVRLLRLLNRIFINYRFSSITRRIIVINLVGVVFLVAGIFYLNQYRVKFIETRVESLTTQAEIIASAIAQTSKSGADQSAETALAPDENKLVLPSGLSNSELSFRIDPEVVSPMLRDLVGPTKTRARVFDTDGTLISDSRQLYARSPISSLDGAVQDRDTDIFTDVWTYLKAHFWTPDLPIYEDKGVDGKAYDEVRIALTGSPAQLMRVTPEGETVISITMPIQRDQTALGALMLTTQGSDIDEIIMRDRLQIIVMAGFVVVVTGLLSLFIAGTVAGPVRRLAIAAERVRKNIKNREQIPDFSNRTDEVGYLSRSFRDMTNALYTRLDAIENFAADVAHELKNPLTSLRNAADLLPTTKSEADVKKLVDIINHDVKRLNRLITDISDASRLDAELARATAKPVNLASLLYTLCDVIRESRTASGLTIVLSIEGCKSASDCANSHAYIVNGHDSRLSQVIMNLLDNAMSFSPKGGSIHVTARRLAKTGEIEVAVEDEGPGIPAENLQKIFNRFYTDRPETFGQNSGLGLNISEQIVKAHRGTIWAENRTLRNGTPKIKKRAAKAVMAEHAAALSSGQQESFACGVIERRSYGARFVIRLPSASDGS